MLLIFSFYHFKRLFIFNFFTFIKYNSELNYFNMKIKIESLIIFCTH